MNRATAGARQVDNLMRVGLFVFLTTFMIESASAQEPVDGISQQGKLYRVHCATCHGDQGRGDGKAARFLFPKARDFSSGKMRIVSAENRVANADDIRGSIERGFPGTSMQSWKHLGDEPIKLLVAEVIRLRQLGVQQRVLASWEEDSPGVTAEPSELERIVKGLTVPSEVVQVPGFEGTDESAVVRGRAVYLRQSCHSCHGNDGSGSWKMDLIDSKGRPSWATDLRFDPMKGPLDEGSLARRIVLGMPGSSMPSSVKLSDQELVDLVRYCQSLSRTPKFNLTNYQRARRAEGFRRPEEPAISP